MNSSPLNMAKAKLVYAQLAEATYAQAKCGKAAFANSTRQLFKNS